jgi:hypothetical protein
VLDDIAPIASAFLDPDVGGEAEMPPLTEPELRAFMLRDLPAMQVRFLFNSRSSRAAGRSPAASLHHPTSSEAESGSAFGCSPGAAAASPRAIHPRRPRAGNGVMRLGQSSDRERTLDPGAQAAQFTREGRLRQLLRYRDGRADVHLAAAGRMRRSSST